jgi:large subunit ribosomal protein L13
MIIDARNLILGRLATFSAKKALQGKNIHIINCEDVIVSGSKKNVLHKYKTKANRGSQFKGPFIPKIPERFVKRAIRNMLPYKNPRGREAFKRIKCYRGHPESIKKEKTETLKTADFSKLPTLKYVTVKHICDYLGGK